MVLLQIRILNSIPITMIIEVIMNKIKFVIDEVDTVIQVARLIKSELSKEKESENPVLPVHLELNKNGEIK
jgi:hypothetical protein